MRKQTDISPEQKELLVKVGMKLKNIRQSRNIKIVQLADETKIHRNTYSLMEQGRIDFQFSTLMRVLDHFGISAFVFFQKL